MKPMIKKVSKVMLALTAVATCAASIAFSVKGATLESASAKVPGTHYQNGDAATYYNTIDSTKSGDALLKDLRELNLSKRKTTYGYDNLNSYFCYTDYDPNGASTDTNGQKYNNKILSFYSGKSTTSYNKEHVWPASRMTGGRNSNTLDKDIYIIRPTSYDENSDRGNSAFVENVVDDVDGFDPVRAYMVSKPNVGAAEGIRGECARVIFYVMTCDDTLLKFADSNVPSAGQTMGKISDLLQWNLDHPVTDREKRRNEGGEYLQGNRNAFVDHPEYACKIWGDFNENTKKICSAGARKAEIRVDKTEITVEARKSAMINAECDEAGAYIKFESADKKIAIVNGNQIVGVKAGTTTVKVSGVICGKSVTTEVKVTVTGGSSSSGSNNGGGCGGSIIASSVILFSSALMGLTLAVVRKKKKEDEEE